MRVAITGHTNFRTILDYTEVIEAQSIKKVIQGDTCWLKIDSDAFKMPEEQADAFVDEAFKTGILDLRGYKTSSIPW